MWVGSIIISLISCHTIVCMVSAGYLAWPQDARKNFRFEHFPPFTDYESKALNGEVGVIDFVREVIVRSIPLAINLKMICASVIIWVVIVLL